MNKQTVYIILGVLAVWYVWRKGQPKKAVAPTKYDETETILAGQSAIYPLDKPNLNGDIGVYS